ncbi:MAG: SDR family NAD(P)-dependent oxidoreductase [Thermodesulfobacteriota bacterium]|nr:SDR family NAD(P)-dependent oxidoreductase [Thermodesulfobacteriota bacterium]
MRLKDQVAVVTGGGGGLGEGICLCLAREGAHVVVSDLKLDMAEKVAARMKEMGRGSLAVQTDVRIANECKNLIEKSLKKMERIDILVCAAGVGGFVYRGDSGEPLTLETVSEEEWDLTIDVNLKGVFLCNRAIAPYFKQQKRGKIINISSVAGRKGIDWIPHYSASKAGVIVLTQAVALQLAPYSINVNTICPGVIWTPMWEVGARVLSQSYPPFKGMNPGEVFKTVVQNMIPFQRPQTPEDIGNAVVFLSSDDAREITGQAINVDGGAIFN